MKRKFKILIITPLVALLLTILLFFFSEWLFPSVWGSYSLGNNFYMIDWDGGGKIIVYCNYLRGRTCYGGLNILPSDSDIGNLHVNSAKYNDTWILVEALKVSDNKKCYYLIRKNFNTISPKIKKNDFDILVKRSVIGPIDSVSIVKILRYEKIDLNW